MKKQRKDFMTIEYLLEKLEEACILKGHSVMGREIDAMQGFPCRSQYERCGGIQKALYAIGRVPRFLKPSPKSDPITKLSYTPLKMRFVVFERDNFTCQYCGITRAEGARLMVDHIVPFSKGGKTIIDNLTTACFFCNLGKRDVILENLSKNKKANIGI